MFGREPSFVVSFDSSGTLPQASVHRKLGAHSESIRIGIREFSFLLLPPDSNDARSSSRDAHHSAQTSQKKGKRCRVKDEPRKVSVTLADGLTKSPSPPASSFFTQPSFTFL